MQDLIESAKGLQDHLQQHGIDSMLIGGVAVAIWGEPRLTRDVDLKVLLVREEAKRLVDVLTKHYQLLAETPEKTLQQFGFLFTKDAAGVRLDLLLAETAFDTEALQRKRTVTLEPQLSIQVASPEDLIIYKMISTRPRDHEDVVGIIRRQQDGLDDAYVLRWLVQFEAALDDSTLLATYQRLRGLKQG